MATVDLQRRLSVQDQVRQDQEVGFGLMFWMARAGELVAPWWSPQRDKQLRSYAKSSDHFSGAEWMIGTKLASVPYRVEARDSSVKAHTKLANEYQAILDNMVQFGQGWEVFWTKFFRDLWECDNGAFGEIIGEGDPNGPRQGPAIGLSHLDSTRCTRTSNPEYPVIYQDTSGRRYRFHHTRIIFRSQSPSTAAEMHNVGFCWLSRAINSIQRLIDVATYNQEKLGSRPLRQLILGKGIGGDMIADAINAAEEVMDNRGLRRYAQAPILAHPSLKDWDIEQRDLASLPDGFDERTTTEFAMFVIALSGGFPPRWLWPATKIGATQADAMYSHVSGLGGGAAWHMNMMRDLLSYSGRAAEISNFLPPKFLPKQLRLVFDFQDDEQDRLQSDVQSTRAKTREVDLNAGVTTIRVSREQALASGDLTQAQFNQMELADGRLPNGDDVFTLFSSTDELVVELLDLSVEQPLLPNLNDTEGMLQVIDEVTLDAQERLVTSRSRSEREKIEQVMAALNKLKELYEGVIIPDEQPAPGIQPSDGQQLSTVELEDMESEGKSITVPFELKSQADFGLSVRAAIRGLWSGATQEFDFVEQMISAIQRQLRSAWAEGAKECGVSEDELTAQEISARDTLITSQFPHLPNFAADIVEGSKANGGKLGRQLFRGSVWVNRYEEARNQGRVMACKDKKLKWVLGEAEHCGSCLKLNGKVKRASVWDSSGVIPQVAGATYLECRGYNCACTLQQTSDKATPGPLPNLP